MSLNERGDVVNKEFSILEVLSFNSIMLVG